ncbi:LysE family translocator [Bailinhaonella thermotolerans]|uniref:LysE family translocator n=1 Tax=Bailinhaonella thermotolerans TaxID=1070861 RepID=A0A3A4BJD1_9ACTN|nr:LysE family translocator [Bailinhaonella thermotolerans]RJL35344.1 LysE family translocator [Bailinhaonella thermotolerans]
MLETLPLFIGATVLISMAPGPSTVVIMRQSMRSGRRAGVAAVLGNEAGWLSWSVAAALGLSALLAVSQLAYDVLRLAGAAFLIWLGVRALWSARRGGPGPAEAAERAPDSWGRNFRLGLLTNLANPKAGLFAMSFLPQFVPPGAPVLGTLLLLAVVSAVIDLAWYLGIVWLVGAARRFFGRPRVWRRLERVSGVVLVALGIRLAVEAR